MPALRGILSNQVPDDAQGELHGAITSLMSLTALVAPLLMTRLFSVFSTDAAPIYFPGAAFLVAGVRVLGSFGLFHRAMVAVTGSASTPPLP